MTDRLIVVRLLLVLLFFVTPAAPFLQVGSIGGVARAASREPVRARHGMVASTSKIASQAGVDGDGAHAEHEHIRADAVVRRGAFLAALVASL